MNPTLKDGQIRFISLFNYNVKKDDVVVYSLDKNFWVVKRVVALKSDIISMNIELVNGVNTGILCINNKMYKNNNNEIYYINSYDKLYDLLWNNTYILKSEEMILLGDNSKNSSDSRDLGILKYDNVIGKIIGKF